MIVENFLELLEKSDSSWHSWNCVGRGSLNCKACLLMLLKELAVKLRWCEGRLEVLETKIDSLSPFPKEDAETDYVGRSLRGIE